MTQSRTDANPMGFDYVRWLCQFQVSHAVGTENKTQGWMWQLDAQYFLPRPSAVIDAVSNCLTRGQNLSQGRRLHWQSHITYTARGFAGIWIPTLVSS